MLNSIDVDPASPERLAGRNTFHHLLGQRHMSEMLTKVCRRWCEPSEVVPAARRSGFDVAVQVHIAALCACTTSASCVAGDVRM